MNDQQDLPPHDSADSGREPGEGQPRTPRVARRLGLSAASGARGIGRASRAAFVGARRFTHAEGAGESGLSRLMELHAFNAAGDAAVAVSLAGTLFFTVPSGEARGQVATFLLLTMLPFAVVAPLIGPFLDRFRRGRRWAIGGTMAARAWLCWILAGAVISESTALFPAALGCLVASKAYGVTRASAVPRVLPDTFTLVKANSRISLSGVAGAGIGGALASAFALLGPQWSLRFAFAVFAIGTILAILLSARVDSSEGEEDPEDTLVIPTGRSRSFMRGIPTSVVHALRCNAGLRFLSGFLTMFMAFVLRDRPFPGWEDQVFLLMGLVIGAAGLGNTVGVLLGSFLKSRKPEWVVVAVLVLDVSVLVVAALLYSLPTAVLLGVAVGLCQSLGKLSLDALIQRDVGEKVRTSVFARSETALQLSWVLGGFLGIGLALQTPRLGLSVTAVILVAWTISAVVFSRKRDDQAPLRPPQPGAY